MNAWEKKRAKWLESAKRRAAKLPDSGLDKLLEEEKRAAQIAKRLARRAEQARIREAKRRDRLRKQRERARQLATLKIQPVILPTDHPLPPCSTSLTVEEWLLINRPFDPGSPRG